MKRKYQIAEFIIVLAFIVAPPLLASPGQMRTIDGRLSFFPLVQLLTAALLDFQSRYLTKADDENERKRRRIEAVVKGSYWWAISLGILMLIYAGFETASILFKLPQNGAVSVSLKTPAAWVNVILSFVAGAYYEEVLYRQYLPETFRGFVGGNGKVSAGVTEIAAVVVFALSHRYLGFTAVLNGFLCGVVLRTCRIRSKSIVPGTVAHFIYNTTLLVFAAMIG